MHDLQLRLLVVRSRDQITHPETLGNMNAEWWLFEKVMSHNVHRLVWWNQVSSFLQESSFMAEEGQAKDGREQKNGKRAICK